jgi:polysaccharide export outer membrane protein
MPKCRLAFLTSLVALCFVFCLFPSGCGRLFNRTATKRTAFPSGASMEGSVTMGRQNLSMAKTLKKGMSSEYLLGPEDTVQITVFRHDELSMETTIGPTGQISYYLIGDIQAAGLTPFELRDKIREELREFLREPEVVVRVTEPRSRKIFILGQVKNPGVYPMRSELTLLEAISGAGGVTPDAYLSGAYVVREGKILLVNFFELLEKGNTEENVPLMVGDVIYIPNNKDQKVFVLGEVNKQSAIPTSDRMTLFEAIAEAGGFTHDANKKSILVMRGNLSEPDIMEINAGYMDLAKNIPLERGDIIYVPNSAFVDAERIALRISHILQPFLQLARGIILQDTAIDVLEGQKTETRIIVTE